MGFKFKFIIKLLINYINNSKILFINFKYK